MPGLLVKRVDFAVYGVDFTANDELIVVGGTDDGKNEIATFSVDIKKREIIKRTDHKLSTGEDCLMFIACHPNSPLFAVAVNESEENIKAGKNENCRLFKYESTKITQQGRVATSGTNRDPKQYQRVIRFSQSGNYLVSGFTDGTISVQNIPSLTKATKTMQIQSDIQDDGIKEGGIQDACMDVDEKFVAVATRSDLTIMSTETSTVVQTIKAQLNGSTSCEFRACRFAKNSSGQKLYAVVNPTSRGSCFICAWSLHSSPARRYPLKKKKLASVCRKNITNFCVSPDGNLLAYTSSDLSIGIVDAKTLRPVHRVERAHGFQITSLAFNRTGKYLAFAAADSYVRILAVPDNLKLGIDFDTPIYVSLCMLMFALLMHIVVQLVK